MDVGKITQQMTPEQTHHMLVDGLLWVGREFNLSEEEEQPFVEGLQKMRQAVEDAGGAMTGFLSDLIEAVTMRTTDGSRDVG